MFTWIKFPQENALIPKKKGAQNTINTGNCIFGINRYFKKGFISKILVIISKPSSNKY